MDKKEAVLERNKISRLLGTEAQDDNLERNIFLLQSLDKQKDIIDVIGKVYVLIKQGQEGPHAFKDIKNEIRALVEALDKYQEAFGKEFKVFVNNFPDAVKEVKVSNAKDFRQDHPKSIRVSNLNEIKPEKHPDEVSIKRPAWYKEFDLDKLFKFSKDSSAGFLKQIKTSIFNSFVKNVKPKEAIPVRLVTEDGEKFYRAGNVYVAGGSGGIIPASLRKTYNVVMADANTEYSQELPDNTKKFLIQCRQASDIKVSTESGESGIKYLTLKSGLNYYEDFIRLQSLTLYFQCADPGKIAEIIVWR